MPTSPFAKAIPVIYHSTADGSIKPGTLDLFVRGGFYGPNEALRKPLIGTPARVVEQMSLDAKNCYTLSSGEKQCNIAGYVGVEAGEGNCMNVYFDMRAKAGGLVAWRSKEAELKSIPELKAEYAVALGREVNM